MYFNPRSRVGNDSASFSGFYIRKYFNPRSRVGNDIRCAISSVLYVLISIHVPAWGTTIITSILSLSASFQSTFPRGERHLVGYEYQKVAEISIHVPAWGTTLGRYLRNFCHLFQSTFPRGERLQISTIFHLYICISSTNSHFSITSFCIFYLIHFFLICFFQLFMVRIFWGFSVYFWFALYRNNT